MITEQHVSVPTAKLLKEAGFNEPCKDVYIDATGWDGKGDIFDERYSTPSPPSPSPPDGCGKSTACT